MLKQNITVLVLSTVAGPNGFKLMPGKVAELEDNDYTRLLIKSETVSLIDPPSLDPDFLEKGGYELQDGYSYDGLKVAEVEEESKKAGKVRGQKKTKPISEGSEEQHSDTISEENSQEEGAMVEVEEEETP